MSFSADVKKELSRVEELKKCCMLAEISGFLRLSGSIQLAGGGKLSLKLTTEDPAIARLFLRRMKAYFGASCSLRVEENAPLKKGRVYELTISPDEGSELILRETGILLVREGYNYFSEEVLDSLVKKKCCKRAFLRGVFLGGGTVSQPDKGYHLDMVCDSEALANDVRKLVNSFGLKAKVVQRRNKFVVYLKEAEQICDLLGILGAHTQLLEYQNVRIVKEAKNLTNRIANCENANMDRAAANAARQREDILLIQDKMGLEELEDGLREVAQLRLSHPEKSLAELAQLMDPPLTKSGINGRLRKIHALAEAIRLEN